MYKQLLSSVEVKSLNKNIYGEPWRDEAWLQSLKSNYAEILKGRSLP